MKFGIAMATSADSWKLVQQAEELGFDHAWFYDTQMLSADCFVAMGAAAVKTKRIRLGTGVLVPTNRIAPVTANAFASLNQLAEMEEYIHTVYALLRKETVEVSLEGVKRKIRFLNPDHGLINTDDPIALHVSAYGPRSRALTARLAAGWLNFIGDVPTAVSALESMQTAWQEAGHDPQELSATAFALGCVLEEGEAYDSPRAMAQAGPRAAVTLHRAADEALAGWQNSSVTFPSFTDAVSGYVELAQSFEPADAPYLVNQQGHLMFVKPEERPFVTAELIRDTSFTATREVLVERIAALRDAGYTQFTVQLTPGQESAIEDWASIKHIVVPHEGD